MGSVRNWTKYIQVSELATAILHAKRQHDIYEIINFDILRTHEIQRIQLQSSDTMDPAKSLVHACPRMVDSASPPEACRSHGAHRKLVGEYSKAHRWLVDHTELTGSW